MTNFTFAALATLAFGLMAVSVGAEPAAPPPPPNAQDIVTHQIATELGRLVIENRTYAVSLDVLRGRIAEVERQLKEAQAKCPAPPAEVPAQQ